MVKMHKSPESHERYSLKILQNYRISADVLKENNGKVTVSKRFLRYFLQVPIVL